MLDLNSGPQAAWRRLLVSAWLYTAFGGGLEPSRHIGATALLPGVRGKVLHSSLAAASRALSMQCRHFSLYTQAHLRIALPV